MEALVGVNVEEEVVANEVQVFDNEDKHEMECNPLTDNKVEVKAVLNDSGFECDLDRNDSQIEYKKSIYPKIYLKISQLINDFIRNPYTNGIKLETIPIFTVLKAIKTTIESNGIVLNDININQMTAQIFEDIRNIIKDKVRIEIITID
jgi:hypothetical protein